MIQKIKRFLPSWSLIHFGLSSVGCLLIDNAVFSAVCLATESALGRAVAIAVSTVAAYVVSGHCNYFYNQRFVFGSVATLKSYCQYWCLVLLNGSILMTVTEVLAARLDLHGLEITLVKLLAQIVLFLFSYTMQRCFIFKRRPTEKEAKA